MAGKKKEGRWHSLDKGSVVGGRLLGRLEVKGDRFADSNGTVDGERRESSQVQVWVCSRTLGNEWSRQGIGVVDIEPCVECTYPIRRIRPERK